MPNDLMCACSSNSMNAWLRRVTSQPRCNITFYNEEDRSPGVLLPVLRRPQVCGLWSLVAFHVGNSEVVDECYRLAQWITIAAG